MHANLDNFSVRNAYVAAQFIESESGKAYSVYLWSKSSKKISSFLNEFCLLAEKLLETLGTLCDVSMFNVQANKTSPSTSPVLPIKVKIKSRSRDLL